MVKWLNMRKFPLFVIILSVLLLAGFIVFTSQSTNPDQAAPPAPPASSYEYFWGENCPYCANVKSFLETWEASSSAKIDKKEVSANTANAGLLLARAVSCKIPKDQIPVPFLFTPEGKCILGDKPIIDFLKGLE